MSLTAARGPFGQGPSGRFNFSPDPPTGSVLFWDAVPYRLRAFLGGAAVFDTTDAKLLHETGHLPVYYVPDADLRHEALEPSLKSTRCPHKGEATYRSIRVGDRFAEDAVWPYEQPLEPASFITGHAAFNWDLLDEWYVEDEQVYGHPRDPFHRVDVYRTTRHVRVSVDGELRADSVRALVLFETALPPRFYLPAVLTGLLEPSDKRTRCAYKGLASYWHVRAGDTLHEDLAWTYPEPDDDARDVRDLIAFFNERVDIAIDRVAQERPVTQWSR